MRPLRLALRALRACRTLVDHARFLRPLGDATRVRLELVVASLRDTEKHLKTALQLEHDRTTTTSRTEGAAP